MNGAQTLEPQTSLASSSCTSTGACAAPKAHHDFVPAAIFPSQPRPNWRQSGRSSLLAQLAECEEDDARNDGNAADDANRLRRKLQSLEIKQTSTVQRPTHLHSMAHLTTMHTVCNSSGTICMQMMINNSPCLGAIGEAAAAAACLLYDRYVPKIISGN